MYQYRAKLSEVIDGDTVDVLIDLGFNLFRKDRIRLEGINAPETRTRNDAEKVAGLATKARVKELIEIKGQTGFTLDTRKDDREKYGRILGVITFDDATVLNSMLLNEGLVKEYHGEKRTEWTEKIIKKT